MSDNIALWRLVYVLPNLLAAFGMVFVAVLAWRFRHQRGGRALWFFAVGAAIWAFSVGLSFIGLTPELILFIWGAAHIGVASAPLALFVFALGYIGYGHLLTRRLIALLTILPVADIIFAWTNSLHGWTWINVWMDTSKHFPMLNKTPGPFLWVYYSYATILAISSIGLLLRRAPELPPQQRRQLYLVMLAFVFPAITCGLFMAGLTPLPNMDLTPLAFNFSGFVLIRGFIRERMFELAPVTANEIYRSLEDPVFVIDDDGRVQDLNSSARKLLPATVGECVGILLPELLPEVGILLSEGHAESKSEVSLDGRYYDVHMTTLRSADGRFSGRLLVWREITEHKRLEAELRRLSVTDSLTGMYNRRHFCACGEEEIKHAHRYKRPLSMVMIDIDYFKEVNDSFGHDAGDRVLLALAALLTKELRASDCIGRIGGEEFALLLPETDEAAAQELGRRLLAAVAVMSVPMADGGTIGITISAGIATLEADEHEVVRFMRRTDRALYQAKNEGRNRLVQLQ